MLNYLVRDNLLPLGTVAVIIAIMTLVGWHLGIQVSYSMYSFPMLLLGPSLVIIPWLCLMFWTLWKVRPEQPTAFLAAKIVTDWRGLERALRGIPILLIFPVFFSVFASYKATLGHVVPFYFDPYARYIDQILHGGDAWRLFAWLTAYPLVTFGLNFIYNIWFFAAFAVLTFCTFIVTDTRLRAQFLVAFLLCWFVIGIIVATALSSAGPCYYAHFYGDASFDYINHYLKSVAEHYPIPALEVQKLLLDHYVDARTGLGEGISAAPSMHVSIAALTAIFLARYGRAAAILGWSYCIVILIASVHLGWHYAIDGYLAIVLTAFVWHVSGRLVDAYAISNYSLAGRLLPYPGDGLMAGLPVRRQ